MALYDYQNDTGLIVPDTSEIREEVIAEYRTALGADLVVEDETPQGTLIVGETLARSGVVRLNAAVANQINPRNAGGIFLDGICNFLGLKRAGAKPSVNRQCKLGGVPNTPIPQYATARDENGNTWRLTQGLLLDSEGDGTGDFECVTKGPIACPAGSMRYIVSQVLGWETVSNPSAAEIGTKRQSDGKLRTIRELTLARQGISISEAIISGLYDPSVGVKSLAYRENYTSEVKVIDGIRLAKHSIYVCCDGGSDADIAMTLLREKTVGAGWNGSVKLDVLDKWSGQKYEVAFDRPTKVPVELQLFVRTGTYQGEPTIDVPKAAVRYAEGEVDGLRGFVLGNPYVSPAEVGVAVAQQLPGLFISGAQARKIGESEWSFEELKFAINELPTLQTGSVSVKVV